MKVRSFIQGLSAFLALAAPVAAQSIESTVGSMAVYGIDRYDGTLRRYGFDDDKTTEIGKLKTSNGKAMEGIRAAGYFPGFGNLFALWADPDDGNKNKLVSSDILNANTWIIASDLEGGLFTGATTVHTQAHPYALFAMQAAKIKPPATITGLINLNPNNSPQNEFTLSNGTTLTFTRDQLAAKDIILTSDGTYYQGHATFIHVKPKGNGNQNGLILDGVAYALQNSNTYDFSGDMEVRVYNDKVGGGKAMGKWWIQVISGTVTVNNEVQILSPNRIAQVDQKTGTVTEIMVLSRSYKGLASTDGNVFFACNDNKLYKIDTVNLTETLVGPTNLDHVSDLEFAGPYLLAYDRDKHTLTGLRTTDAKWILSPADHGLGALGSIMFTPLSMDPARLTKAFD